MDSINFVANHLMKYRYNELHNIEKQIELVELNEERDKFMHAEMVPYFIKIDNLEI